MNAEPMIPARLRSAGTHYMKLLHEHVRMVVMIAHSHRLGSFLIPNPTARVNNIAATPEGMLSSAVCLAVYPIQYSPHTSSHLLEYHLQSLNVSYHTQRSSGKPNLPPADPVSRPLVASDFAPFQNNLPPLSTTHQLRIRNSRTSFYFPGINGQETTRA